VYILEANNLNVKLASSSEDDLRKFVSKINRLRSEKIVDYNTLNETFVNPYAEQISALMDSAHLLTMDNIQEYTDKYDSLKANQDKLWESHVTEFIEKNSPEWDSFFNTNDIFSYIYEELNFTLYRVGELNLAQCNHEYFPEVVEEFRCAYESNGED
jgi:hypothetical protein